MPSCWNTRLVIFTFVIFVLICSFYSQTPVFAAQVTLAWDSNEPVPDGYRVYQRTESEAYDYSHAVWQGTSTECTLDGLADDQQYYFVVRAYAGSDESGNSNEVSLRTKTKQTDTSVLMLYTILAISDENGSIEPSGSLSTEQGASQLFTITAQSGYHIADVRVDGVSVGAVSDFSFTNISEDHRIYAIFESDPPAADQPGSADSSGAVSPPVDTYMVTATSGANGSIVPAGHVIISAGESSVYTITPDDGYITADVRVDGISVGAAQIYSFDQINSDHTIEATFAKVNQPPVADAGPDQTVDEATLVTLSGLNSIDPDDGIAAYQWRQIEGPPVDIDNFNDAEATFAAPNVDELGEVLVFELAVTDFGGAVAIDSCLVNVTWVNSPPLAQAGDDQTVNSGDKVYLDAADSSDADNGLADFQWEQRQGPQVSLSDSHAIQPYFIAPDVDPNGASIVFELTVTDGAGLQDTDSCVVTVAWDNEPPVADAGPDLVVDAGVQVALDGSGSSDPDDGLAGYQWKQTDGPPVSLSDSTADVPEFAAPLVSSEGAVLVFELTVTDLHGLQCTDSCQVNVQGTSRESEPADTEPPALTVSNPSGALIYVRQRSLKVQGWASDNIGVERVLWSNNRGYSGEADLDSDGWWEIKNLRLKSWFNTITITAYDSSGNEESVAFTVFSSARR